MTRKIRWLSAVVLLLAVGAVTVRAEEEEAPPPGRPTAELLPAPLPGAVDPSAPRLFWPSTMPGVWSFPSPCPVPMPCPLTPAVFTPPYGAGCGVCPVCPCPLCAAPQAPESPQYVVEMKMFKAAERPEVVACPRVSILAGQTATVQSGNDSPMEHCSLQMQATVQQGFNKSVVLDLCVTDSCSHTGEPNVRTHTETTQTHCAAELGSMKKLELEHDPEGVCTSWVEVTVTAVETEARTPKTASAGACPKAMVCEEEEDAQPFGLNDFVEVLQGCFEAAADTASGMAGATACDDGATTAEYLQHPPQYCPVTPVQTTCPAECAPSAHSCCTAAACTQCAATESVQRLAVHISIDASNDRKCVETTDGGKCFKATADHVVVHDDCILLEGDVRAESSDDSGHGKTIIKADHLMLDRKDGVMTIRVDD